MIKKPPAPGVSREARISDEGLQRLEQQLMRGGHISPLVLAQWIKRYGEPAREMIKRYAHQQDSD
ncbi:MAG: hypothetical protein HYZ31_12930 [Gammaproteobacteria bacterium]|jgi:hypothetical protein|nr:hypothetical protein [Gammaproteobacteria bacterium]